MEREQSSDKFLLGSKIPQFSLPSTEGELVTEQYFSSCPAGVVVFTCNHCPYVKGSDGALLEIVKIYQPLGVHFLAISSNDVTQYAEDSFDKMKEKSRELNLSFPYLYDESQQVAKAFDAACTPEYYVFDSAQRLVFHGTINNSPRFPEKVSEPYLKNSLDQILAGNKPNPSFVHPLGCSIKWKM